MTQQLKIGSTVVFLGAVAAVWQVMTRDTVPQVFQWWLADMTLYRFVVVILLLALLWCQVQILARPVAPSDLVPKRGGVSRLRRPLVRSVSPGRSLVGHVTLVELVEAFDELTSVQADERVAPVRGQWFKYQGPLRGVDRESMRPLAGGEPPVVASLETIEGWEFPFIRFSFAPETASTLATLRRGDVIAMEGRLRSVSKSGAYLDNAELSFVEPE